MKKTICILMALTLLIAVTCFLRCDGLGRGAAERSPSKTAAATIAAPTMLTITPKTPAPIATPPLTSPSTPTAPGVIPVLLYHDFVEQAPLSDPYDFKYLNTARWLEENLVYLLNQGYDFISFTELDDALLGRAVLPDKPILLTFDDGNYGQYSLAFPVLNKLGVKAAAFVVTDWVGREIKGVKYFGWEEAKKMKASGLIDIYSHNKRHVFMNELSDRQSLREVAESFKVIEKHIGDLPLKVFAYPYGSINARLVKALREYGVDFQVYDIGLNYIKAFDKTYVRRILVTYAMSGKDIHAHILRGYRD